MAKNNKADMSCARVKKYTASDVSKAERHNERKNETYENMNVIEERIPFNVHFKTPTAPTYMEQLKQMETDGLVSLRGLRKDATIFNEIVIDVNTMYFERNGGYEYAKQFYEEAFHFIEEKFGAENVISAVMHADEINIAATEELGKEVYHYHLHAMVLPVVEKEILWSKRCKDEKLRGTVKEVVHQISHSKKWKSDIPLTDEKGNPLLRKNGKPMFRASYSILQDELFNHMTEQGLGIWFGLPIVVAIIVSTMVIIYFIQTISAEISAYIGFGALMSQIGTTVSILALLLICYFISTWLLFKKSIK